MTPDRAGATGDAGYGRMRRPAAATPAGRPARHRDRAVRPDCWRCGCSTTTRSSTSSSAASPADILGRASRAPTTSTSATSGRPRTWTAWPPPCGSSAPSSGSPGSTRTSRSSSTDAPSPPATPSRFDTDAGRPRRPRAHRPAPAGSAISTAEADVLRPRDDLVRPGRGPRRPHAHEAGRPPGSRTRCTSRCWPRCKEMIEETEQTPTDVRLQSVPAWYPATYPAPRPTTPCEATRLSPPVTIGALQRRSTHMLRIQAALPDRYTAASQEELATWIGEAKATLGERLLILGHHYQRDEVMAWADARGDSYGLSRLAADSPAEFIVFCGVHFMAESADILTGDHQAVDPPRPQRRLLHGRHGRHRLGRGGVGGAGRRHRHRAHPAHHLHELIGRPEGVRGPQGRGGVHLVQRQGRRLLGPGAGRQAALLPRPAPRAATPPTNWASAPTTCGCGTPAATWAGWRRPTSRRRRSSCGRATARCTSASPSAHVADFRAAAPRRDRDRAPRVRPRGGRGRRPGRVHRLHHPGRRRRPRRLGDRRGHRDPPRPAAGGRAPRPHRRVPRPADLPVLHHVPRRRRPPGLGPGEPGARARW